MPSPASKWIIFPKNNAPVWMRLFCLPHAGGSASMFRAWSEELPPGIQVCPVQLPGRQARLTEPPYTSLPLLVTDLAQILLPYLDVPFALFGHSMGALISFELARQLRRQGAPEPSVLLVASCRPPHLRLVSEQIHKLSDADFMSAWRRFGGATTEFLQNPELRQLMLPTLRADVRLCETYVYKTEEPLGCPIWASAGLYEGYVSRYDLEAWRHQTHSEFKLELFPGNHFFLESARKPLLRAVSQQLLSY